MIHLYLEGGPAIEVSAERAKTMVAKSEWYACDLHHALDDLYKNAIVTVYHSLAKAVQP